MLNRIWLKVTKLNLLSIEMVCVNIDKNFTSRVTTHYEESLCFFKNRISSALELIMILLNAVIMA